MRAFRNFAAGMAASYVSFETVRYAIDQLNTSLQDMDETVKAARRLGLGPELLAQMKLLGELSGTNADAIEKMFTVLQRRIGHATRGLGEAVKAFDDLGISIEDISELSLQDQMVLVANALESVENEATRASLGMALFSESFQESDLALRAIANGGFLEVERATARTGKALREFGQDVERFNDDMAIARATIGGFWDEYAGRIAREFNEQTRNVTAMREQIQNLFTWDDDPLSEFKVDTQRAVSLAQDAVQEIQETTAGTGGLFGPLDLQLSIMGAEQAMKGLNAEVERLEQLRTAGEALTRTLRTPMERAADEAAELVQLLNVGAISSATLGRGFDAIVNRLMAASDEVKEISETVAANEIGATSRTGGLGAIMSARARQENKALAVAENTARAAANELRLSEARNDILNELRREMGERAPVNIVTIPGA